MHMSAPVSRANSTSWLAHALSLCWLLALGLLTPAAQAQDPVRLEGIDVQPLAGQQVELRLRLSGTAPEPMTFTIDDPARISLDLPNTTLALDSRRQDANVGPLTTVLAAEANGRTRVVMNLSSMVPYTTRVEGNSVYVLIGQAPGEASAPSVAAQPSQSATPRVAAAAGDRSIRNIDFRRGADGSGRIVVELTDASGTISSFAHDFIDLEGAPTVELPFENGPIQVQQMRIAIRDLAPRPDEAPHIHVRELRME